MEQENKKEKWFINQLSDVLKYKKLPLNCYDRMLLIAIASHANQDGKCNIYLEDIATYMGVSRKNLSKHITKLKNKKILSVKKQFIRGTKCMTKSTYMINLKAIIELSIDQNGEPIITKCLPAEGTSLVKIESKSGQNQAGGVFPQKIGCLPWEDVKLISNLKANTRSKEDMLDIGQIMRFGRDMSAIALPKNVIEFPQSGFDSFWMAYPRKEKKKSALKAWMDLKLEDKAEEIIVDVVTRTERHIQWQNKQFIPHPATYLRAEQWTDEILEETHEKARTDNRIHRETRQQAATRQAFDEYEENERRRQAENLS